eukprot:Clim_evm27s235 gene=Clim_evmTU27s235
MDEDDLYNEFGDYIGDPSPEAEENHQRTVDLPLPPAADSAEDIDDGEDMFAEEGREPDKVQEERSAAITRYGDGQHHQSSTPVPGKEVEVLVHEEDTQSLSRPIISSGADVKHASGLRVGTENLPYTRYSKQFLADLALGTGPRCRVIALVGHQGHGKTSLADLLIEQTHHCQITEGMQLKWTDTLYTEQRRGCSLQVNGFSTVLEDSGRKSRLLHILDTPGHPNFGDEVACALRMSDGAVLVVDVVEGLMVGTRLVMQQCVRAGVPMTLCLTKLDRLIMDLRLPPNDGYAKIQHVIEELNAEIMALNGGSAYSQKYFMPASGNVIFACCGQLNFTFSLYTVAKRLILDRRQARHDKGRQGKSKNGHKDRHGRSLNKRLVPKTAADMSDPDFLIQFEELLLQDVSPKANDEDTHGDNGGEEPKVKFDAEAKRISRCLFGAWSYDSDRGGFVRLADGSTKDNKLTFVQFVLEPMYKLFARTIEGAEKELSDLLRSVGIKLSKKDLGANTLPLLRKVCTRYYGPVHVSFVDLVIGHCPSSTDWHAHRWENMLRTVRSSDDTRIDVYDVDDLPRCDPHGPLLAQVVKMAPLDISGQPEKAIGDPMDETDSSSRLLCWVRILSGTMKSGSTVHLLGSAFSQEDMEEHFTRRITKLYLPGGRYKVPVQAVGAGNICLVAGIDGPVEKTATILQSSATGLASLSSLGSTLPVLSAPVLPSQPVVHISAEPIVPRELPLMMEALRCCTKVYPALEVVVEESGLKIIKGTGELYLDCVMHDLREVYGRQLRSSDLFGGNTVQEQLEVRVSDPSTPFRESIEDQSVLPCYAQTPNRRNHLTIVAEPLDPGLAADIALGMLAFDRAAEDAEGELLPSSFMRGPRTTNTTLQLLEQKYNWDVLASRSLWAFGPAPETGANVLLNDTFPDETDPQLLTQVRDSVVQGFRWATREGPLCEEPMRNVKFRIFDASLSTEPVLRGAGQLIPTARKVCHAAVLTASPRLLEPWYAVTVECTSQKYVDFLQQAITKSRGRIVAEYPKAGTPFHILESLVPVMDSFGLEVSLRTSTKGQVMPYFVFSHWDIVPGDPLDDTIELQPMVPQELPHLAREFAIKTRRRKGLGEAIALSKYVEDPHLLARAAEFI